MAAEVAVVASAAGVAVDLAAEDLAAAPDAVQVSAVVAALAEPGIVQEVRAALVAVVSDKVRPDAAKPVWEVAAWVLGGSVAIDSRLPVAANSTVSLVCPPTRGCTTSVQRASVAEMWVSGAAPGLGAAAPA